MPTVRTRFQPDHDHEVSDEEAAVLEACGLLAPPALSVPPAVAKGTQPAPNAASPTPTTPAAGTTTTTTEPDVSATKKG